MMSICTKYGFDILIISGSNGGHRRHKNGRLTMPKVHKLRAQFHLYYNQVGQHMSTFPSKCIERKKLHLDSVQLLIPVVSQKHVEHAAHCGCKKIVMSYSIQ